MYIKEWKEFDNSGYILPFGAEIFSVPPEMFS
jgi:hypothetical protein